MLAPWCPLGARRRQLVGIRYSDSVRLVRLTKGSRDMFNRKSVAYCVAVGTLVVATSATAQVMTTSPSPSQASPSQASPMQSTSPQSSPIQAVPNVPLDCAYFQRNSNGSWTQQRPVTVDGKTMNVPGKIISGGTVVGGIDLPAALNRECR